MLSWYCRASPMARSLRLTLGIPGYALKRLQEAGLVRMLHALQGLPGVAVLVSGRGLPAPVRACGTMTFEDIRLSSGGKAHVLTKRVAGERLRERGNLAAASGQVQLGWFPTTIGLISVG